MWDILQKNRKIFNSEYALSALRYHNLLSWMLQIFMDPWCLIFETHVYHFRFLVTRLISSLSRCYRISCEYHKLPASLPIKFVLNLYHNFFQFSFYNTLFTLKSIVKLYSFLTSNILLTEYLSTHKISSQNVKIVAMRSWISCQNFSVINFNRSAELRMAVGHNPFCLYKA